MSNVSIAFYIFQPAKPSLPVQERIVQFLIDESFSLNLKYKPDA